MPCHSPDLQRNGLQLVVVATLGPLHVTVQTPQVGRRRVGTVLAHHPVQVRGVPRPQHPLDLVVVLGFEPITVHGAATLVQKTGYLPLADGRHGGLCGLVCGRGQVETGLAAS